MHRRHYYTVLFNVWQVETTNEHSAYCGVRSIDQGEVQRPSVLLWAFFFVRSLFADGKHILFCFSSGINPTRNCLIKVGTTERYIKYYYSRSKDIIVSLVGILPLKGDLCLFRCGAVPYICRTPFFFGCVAVCLIYNNTISIRIIITGALNNLLNSLNIDLIINK